MSVAEPAESERSGGACCSVCAGYLALNRAYHARQPVCDAAARGACPVSCAEGRPAPLACEGGRCVFTYPPVIDACARDSDCVTVPRLRDGVGPSTCRVACGQYIAASREWDGWASMHWQNRSVVGECPRECVETPLPAAACVEQRCVIRPPSTLRLTRVDLRAPSAVGALPATAISALVATAQPQFTQCVEGPRSIRPIGYAGFTMRLVIEADGRVSSIDPGELASHLPAIAACMTRAIRALRFTSTSAQTTVEYPMGAAFETQ